MSLGGGLHWSYDGLDFTGYSMAGQTTSIVFKNPKICFDIAQGLPFHLSAKLFCLSHLHADHGAGLNYLLSQRSLFRMPEAKIMLPETYIPSVEIILREWQKIEGFQYSYELIPATENSEYHFSEQYVVRPFKTLHRVPSCGYLVYEKKKHLKPEFQGADSQSIIQAKKKGLAIEEPVEIPLVAFTGDTQIEFIDSHPDVLQSKILFMECTYWDHKKTVEQAREWGHIHLREFFHHIDRFKNQQVCMIHVSARHSTAQVQKILQEQLPESLHGRVSLFPRPIP